MRVLFPALLALAAAPLSAQTAPPSFATCAVCHAVKPGGPKKIGPELNGVAGKAAAAKAGFAYSKALKASKIVWTDAKLDAYLAQPAKAVPGGSMAFSGIRDAKVRAAVIAYLKSLK